MISSNCLLRLVIFCSALVFGQAFDSKVNLEDYMRYTPAPAPANETATGGDSLDTFTSEPSALPTAAPTTLAPSGAPTEAPTTSAPSEIPTVAESEVPTAVPSNSPTEPPTTSAPSNSPTETKSALPTEAATTLTPTDPPTEAATTASPSKAPTTPPRLADAELELAQTEEPEKEEEEAWDLFSETLEYVNSIGEVHIDFSLYSPNVTNLQMNFMKLKMGVCKSIDPLVCDLTHPVKEEGPEYCAIRDDVLLRDGVAQSRRDPIITDQDVSVMALGSTNVKDGEGIIGGSPIAWTTWRMSYNVLQLGNGLRQHINETEGTGLTEEQVNSIGLTMVQQMMSVNMERTLRSGLFEQDLNEFMKDIVLVASVVGEEVTTYEPIVGVKPPSPVHEGLELENGEDEGEGGGGLMIVFFFAGLGVACCVIVTLLYFSFRSRRSVTRRKRTIVILDDTSKSCTDSQGSASEEKTAAPVVDTSVLEEEAPRVRRHEVQHQEEEPEPDVENDAASAGQEEASVTVAGEGGDVESQWGRSMAQSSAYTGSISAITGVSGLEHSDTWSVGSMSIDLAEWG